MSTISGISGANSAWSTMSASRNKRPPSPEEMFAKVDTDSDGSVSKAELQGLLEDISKKTGVSSGSSTDELFSKMDSNSDGSLSQDELGEGMKSVMPPPPSTMDFAQSRSAGSSSDDLFTKVDSNGDGSISTEEMASLRELMDKMASSKDDAVTATSGDDELFSQLDTDGNGSLSKTEFEAGRPQPGQGPQSAGGMPPPPPAGGAAKAGSSTSYDPLDTNQDGVVSAEERLAGNSASDPLQALFKSIDSDGDGAISASESGAFVQQLSEQVQRLSETSQGSDRGSSSKQGNSDLAQLARLAYDQVASGWAGQSRGAALSAVA